MGKYSLDSCTLAIDIGTTLIKCMLLDSKGRPIENSLSSWMAPLVTEPSGVSIMDPNELVKRAEKCISKTIAAMHQEKYHISSVGICSYWHSCMGLDENGNIAFPIITWGDTRAEAIATRLKSELNESEIHKRTGCAIHSSYYPARLVWLRETYPDLFLRVRKWLSPADYLIYKLIGTCVTSHSMASATGLYHQNNMRWDEEALELCDITPESLPEISDEPIAPNVKELNANSLLKRLSGALWCPGIGDGAASNIGCGCAVHGNAAINLGTSGAIRSVWRGKSSPNPKLLWRYRLNATTPIYGAAFSDGGADLLWAEKTLRLPKDFKERMDAEKTFKLHGLTFSPYLSGERSPNWRAGVKGSLTGLTLHTSPEEIYQAILVGVAMQFKHAMDIIESSLDHMDRITISGGAVESRPYLANIFSHILERPLHHPLNKEVTCHGAGVYAMHSISAISSLNDVIIDTEIIDPNANT